MTQKCVQLPNCKRKDNHTCQLVNMSAAPVWIAWKPTKCHSLWAAAKWSTVTPLIPLVCDLQYACDLACCYNRAGSSCRMLTHGSAQKCNIKYWYDTGVFPITWTPDEPIQYNSASKVSSVESTPLRHKTWTRHSIIFHHTFADGLLQVSEVPSVHIKIWSLYFMPFDALNLL